MIGSLVATVEREVAALGDVAPALLVLLLGAGVAQLLTAVRGGRRLGPAAGAVALLAAVVLGRGSVWVWVVGGAALGSLLVAPSREQEARPASRPTPRLLIGAGAALLGAHAGGLITLVLGLEIVRLARDPHRLRGGLASSGLLLTLGAVGLALSARASDFATISALPAQWHLKTGIRLEFAFLLLLLALRIEIPSPSLRRRPLGEARRFDRAVFDQVVPRSVAAIAFVRVLELTIGTGWLTVAEWLAIALVFWGAIAALRSRDVLQRLSACALGHLGLALLPISTLGDGAWRVMTLQIVALALAYGGAFACLARLYGGRRRLYPFAELGLAGRRAGFAAAGLGVCLISIAGLPPTIGFLADTSTLLHLVGSGQAALAALHAVGRALIALAALGLAARLLPGRAGTSDRQPGDRPSQLRELVTAAVAVAIVVLPALRPALLLRRIGDMI